jgi:hypothetical protein
MSLGVLDINDHSNYIVAGPEFMGGQISWDRTQVSSPFADGAVTTMRKRGVVTENVAVEVLGDDTTEVQANVKALVQAFMQDSFIMSVSFDSAVSTYQCEASDYKIVTSTPRWAAKQVQVMFSVPRHPIPLTGDM